GSSLRRPRPVHPARRDRGLRDGTHPRPWRAGRVRPHLDHPGLRTRPRRAAPSDGAGQQLKGQSNVEYVRLGPSALKVSRLCLGMMSYCDPAWREWVLAEDDAFPIVRRAVEHGINFFDTADVYSSGASEAVTGRLLQRLFAHRDDYVLATKVYSPTGPGPN